MALPTVGDAAYPTPAEVRDAILRTIALACSRRGVTANVLPGSDHYIRADAFAKRVTVAMANNRIALADYSPLTATGDALRDLCTVYGVPERPASSASGSVTIKCSGSITIPADFVATAPSGLKYRTTGASIAITTGAKVELVATSTGAATNVDPATVLTWDSAAIGALASTCTVDADGFTGGFGADTDEQLRVRLLDRLANPAGGGNVAQVRQWAEDASSAVERAFCYAGVRGAGTYDVALVAEGGDRTVPGATVTAIDAVLAAKHPGHADVNTTTVSPERVDVILSATMPTPASTGGAGNGWRDTVPWPSGAVALGSNDGKVTAYSAPTATVRTTTAPVAGQRIGIWYAGTDEGQFYEYTIATVGGIAGAWTITVVGGFIVSPLNCYVSAGAVRLADYGATFLALVRGLGPGEKTANEDILPRGRRQPTVDVAAPSDLTTTLLASMSTTYPEITDLSYAARVATGTTTALTSPSVPVTTADPPKILVLKHFALRKA